jgi:hypothetical protein
VIDAVRLTFAALREAGTAPDGELTVRALPDGPPGAYLGLDTAGRSHLLIESDGGEESAPVAAAAVAINNRQLVVGGRTQQLLDVRCESEALTEVFDHFAAAIIERLSDSTDSALTVVLDVFERWRRFLITSGAGPSRDRLASTFGELLVLLDVLVMDARRVGVWVGPFKNRHDFRAGSVALEVKTTRTHTARTVTIHGEDQLVPPEGGELYLHLVRLEEVPDGGESVTSLVDSILSLGAPVADLFDAMLAAGIPPADLPAAARVSFDVLERITFPVDDRTPRIVPETFAAGARPAGILDVTYRLDLDHVLDTALTETTQSALIARFADPDAA